jgi:Domain of unknown function (DUF4304)
MATPQAEAMTAIVREIAPMLKHAGFRKSRHRFNRTEDDGIVHALDFQMGAFEPPGTVPAPPHRLSLYGKFTVNLGVHVPSMVVDERTRPTSWVGTERCELRARLGALATDGAADLWWSLDDPHTAAADVGAEICRHAFPWFLAFRSEQDVLAAYRSRGHAGIGMHPAGPLHIAWMLRHIDPPAAETILRDYLRGELSHHHRTWVNELLRANGFGDLVPT